MRIIAGMGVSACLALALAGCANQCGVQTAACPPAEPAAAQAAATPAKAKGPVIAVMPFIGVGDAPASGLLVAEVMARRLQDGGNCAIVWPEAVARLAGAATDEDLDPVDAGRKAGAHYVVTGRLTDYAVGGDSDLPKVGLAVRLLDTKSGTVVWTGDGLKSAPEIPEGGLDMLASGACADLAGIIHNNIDPDAVLTAPVPPAPVRMAEADTTPLPEAKPSVMVDGLVTEAPVDAEVYADAEELIFAAPSEESFADNWTNTPPPPAEAEQPIDAEPPVTIVTTREVDAPAAPMGEGTADWAIALEDMPEYLESIGAPALATTAPVASDEDVLAAAPGTPGVGSILGMEKEEDMTGTLLVPGAVEVSFLEEDVLPEEFGVQTEEQDASSAPMSSGPVGEVLSGAVARSAVRPPLDADDEPGLTDLPASHIIGEETKETIYAAEMKLEKEEEKDSFDDKFSIDNIDLNFFETLSESLER